MSTDRFDLVPLFRGHWRTLIDLGHPTSARVGGDLWARGIVIVVPLATAVTMYGFGGKFREPGAILTGLVLLAGGFLSAFTHVASLRQRLTERAAQYEHAERANRDYLDETATSLLVGSLLSGVAATFLIVAMNFASPTGGITGIAAAIITYLATYIGVLFLMTIPAMYAAYVETNRVRKEIAGFRS